MNAIETLFNYLDETDYEGGTTRRKLTDKARLELAHLEKVSADLGGNPTLKWIPFDSDIKPPDHKLVLARTKIKKPNGNYIYDVMEYDAKMQSWWYQNYNKPDIGLYIDYATFEESSDD